MTFYACAASRNRKRSLARMCLVRPIVGWEEPDHLHQYSTADAGVLGIALIAKPSLSIGPAEGCGTVTMLQIRLQKSGRSMENCEAEPN